MFKTDYSLFDYLAGRWTIAREIDDHLAKLKGSFTGTGTFLPTPSPFTLDYREVGTLRFGPFDHAAERHYSWRCKAPDRATVHFDDGRYFHVVNVQGALAEVDHPCGRDHYKGHYQFDSPDSWRLTWLVQGPRKDYRMQSTFSRSRTSR